MAEQLSREEVYALLNKEPPKPAELVEKLGPEVAQKVFGGEVVPQEEGEPEGFWETAVAALTGQLPYQKAARTGMARSGIRTYLGAKELLGQREPQDDAIQEMMRRDADEAGGFATAGQALGDIGQMAVPGGAVLKLARAARLGAAATPVGASVISGVGGAAPVAVTRTPEEGETRAGNVLQESLAAAAGGYVGGKLAQGVDLLDSAKELLKEGAYLTPGMAAKSEMLKSLEAIMDVTPILARGTKAARQAARESWEDVVLNTARAPGAPKLTGEGSQGITQLKEGFRKAYDAAWAKAGKTGDVVAPLKVLQRRFREFDQPVRRKLKRLINDIGGDPQPQRIDKVLRASIKQAKEDPALMEVLQDMRAAYRESLGPGVRAALREVDKAYPGYLAVKKAASKAAVDRGMFTPQQLGTAARQIGGETAAATGTAPMLPKAIEGAETVGRNIGGQPLEWFRRVAPITPTPLPLRAAGQVITGQTEAQKLMQEAFRQRPTLGAGLFGGLVPSLTED